MNEIIIGRNEADRKKYGMRGTILIGKQFITMGTTTTLSGNIYMDVAGAHVVFICGKRGGGKSYTMGVIAEGLADIEPEIAQNLSIIMLDTMGIYWTMKYPNRSEAELLKEYNLKPKPLDIKIYTPQGFYYQYKEKGIPTDYPFTIKPSELTASDWAMTFDIKETEPIGVLIERILFEFQDKGIDYDIDDIIAALERDQRAQPAIKDAAINMFMNTKKWGVFSKQGTPLKELAKGGQVTVLDVSCYATMNNGWKIKALVVGIVSQKLFVERMLARKDEEFAEINKTMSLFASDKGVKQDMPLVWLVIDEAHEFLPREGKTAASDALVTIMREGRQPGISLILATQQPGKIHTDVMTQSDTVLSHRITAKIDVEALGMLMQSYMREGLVEALDKLPRVKGAAILFDDSNERMYPMRIRPRFTWHGGSSPTAIKEKGKGFEF
ncbi:MAG: ATP-binding protein [Candidatus Woesearchaeota archaeon]